MKRFNKKIVIVTGGGRGIGRAVALAFLAEGARVAIAERDAALLAETRRKLDRHRSRLIVGQVDICDRRSVEGLLDSIGRRWGCANVLVNCAGVFPKRVPFVDQTESEWRRVIDVNVLGTLGFTQSVVRRMIAAGVAGRIINISSIAATRCRTGIGGQVQYHASKGAVDSITRALANELAAHDIVVNGLAFGFVDTELSKVNDMGGEAFQADYVRRRRIPLGRISQPEDCAKAVLMLASEDCVMITGETIHQDGGLHVTF